MVHWIKTMIINSTGSAYDVYNSPVEFTLISMVVMLNDMFCPQSVANTTTLYDVL